MFAGMAGGATEALCLQPLDVAKTRLQLDSTGKYRGLFHTVRTIASEEGFRALYKGLTVFQVHLVTKYALRFGSFQYFKSLMGVSSSKGGDRLRNLGAGLMAGVTEAILIVTPFERVKTVLQQQIGMKKQALRYKGPVHAAMTIVREEGIGSLWNGAMPTIIRQASNQAALFASFPIILSLFSDRVEGDGKHQAIWKPFLTGLIAATIGPLLNCPMDVVKTRMMAAAEGERRYKGWVHATRTIAAEEGIGALWKGIIPRLARLAPGQAITWTVVTMVQTMFERRQMGEKF